MYCDATGHNTASARRAWLLAGALLTVGAIAWFAYSPILGAWFRDDDFWWLSTAQLWDAGELSVATAPAGVAPVYNLIYHLTYQAAGLDARSYFAALLACHAVNACLVVLLAGLITRSLWAGWGAGVLFAVLFSHHEAVTWPAAGPHVFTAFSVLVAVTGWIVYRRGWRPGLALSIVFSVVAVLTKDSGVSVIPILLVLEWTLFRRSDKRVLAWQALPLLCLIAWRALMPPSAEPMAPGSADYSPGLHMLTNLVLVVPQMLVPDLGFENYLRLIAGLTPAALLPAVVFAARAAMVLVSLLAAWGVWRGSAPVRLGILWCYVAFAPFLPFSYTYARAPRYLYISSIGLALLAALAVQAIAKRLRGRPTAGIAIVALAVVYLAGSLVFARQVCQNRLRDSQLRQHVAGQIVALLPAPEPGAPIHISGLPDHLRDLELGLPVLYSSPVDVRVSDTPAPKNAYVFEFARDATGRLLEFTRAVEAGPPSSPTLPRPASSHTRR